MTEENNSLLSESVNTDTETTATTSTNNAVENNTSTTETTKTDVQVDSKSFYDSLPDDLKKHQSLQKFNTKEDLASSYVELSNKLGKRFDDLSVDEIKSLNSKFDVPNDAEGYGITDTDNVLDAKELSKVFKELEVPRQLGVKMFDYLKETTIKQGETKEVESVGEFNRRQEETIMNLKKEYGVDWDKRVKLANKAIKYQPNGEVLYDKLAKAGLSDDIDVIKMFVGIGKGLVEDKILGEDVGDFGMSPAQASDELAGLALNKTWTDSLLNTGHPGHVAAQEKFQRLHKIKARLINGK